MEIQNPKINDFQDELNQVNLRFLRYMMLGLGVYYLLRGLSFFTFEGEEKYLLISVALATSFYGFFVYSTIRMGTFIVKFLNAAALSAALALIINVYWIYYLTNDLFQIYFCFAAFIAFSLTTIRLKVWVLELVIGGFAYYYMVLEQGMELQKHSLLFIAGLVLSSIFFLSRRSIVKNQINLLLETRSKNEELKKMSKVKSQFVSTVSHELRTPLTSINGSLDLILNGGFQKLDIKTEKLAEMARRNTQNLTSLVNDLLDIEKITKGGMKFQKSQFHLDNFLLDVVETDTPIAIKENLTLKTDLDAKNAIIESDEKRLTQVLNNLISNAIKFSDPENDIVIKSRQKNGTCKIEVTNQGRYILPEDQVSIFDRFYQIDSSDHRDKGGIGLGLNICREIMDGLDGEIGVVSKETGLTTFFITLPRAN